MTHLTHFVLGFSLMLAIAGLVLLSHVRDVNRRLAAARTSDPAPATTPVVCVASIPPNPTRQGDSGGRPTAVAYVNYIGVVCACAPAITAHDATRLQVTLTVDGVAVLTAALQVVLAMPIMLDHDCPAGARVQLDIRGQRAEPGSAIYVWFTGRQLA